MPRARLRRSAAARYSAWGRARRVYRQHLDSSTKRARRELHRESSARWTWRVRQRPPWHHCGVRAGLAAQAARSCSASPSPPDHSPAMPTGTHQSNSRPARAHHPCRRAVLCLLRSATAQSSRHPASSSASATCPPPPRATQASRATPSTHRHSPLPPGTAPAAIVLHHSARGRVAAAA